MAHDPFAQDAWTRARDRFVEDLSEAERCIYHQSSLEMILYDASAAQKHHQDTSTGRYLMSKLQPFTSAIEQYGEALDVYVSAYPLVLSPLWGSLRIVLHLAREFSKYFEKLIDMFERIGDILPRFRAYERLFPNNERLLHSLSVVYVDILKFCYDAKAVFRRSKRLSVKTLKISLKLTWKPFDLQFGEHLRKFREHKKTVEKEAELSHMLESADTKALVLANQMQLQKEKQENDRIKFLSELSAVSHVDLHKMQRQSHCSGTGSWALETAEYSEWKSSDRGGGLCYYGIHTGAAGCGKSILASTILEDLFIEEQRSSTPLVYYYCSFADPRSLVKSQILGNIMRQLIHKGAILQETQREFLEAFLKDGRTPTDERLIHEVRGAAERLGRLFIVFDGLDECQTDTLQGIAGCLVRLTMKNFSQARVLLTCREESHIMRFIHDWPRVQLDETSCAGDIYAFVESSVRSRIESGQLEISSTSLEDEVVKTLNHKAHGMFLWVHFQLIDLCGAASVDQIRATLKSLPDGLGETYDRILDSIGLTHIKASIALKVFQWLACARRPLQVEELQEAVAFDKSDKSWDLEKIPDSDLLLQSCKSLVIRDNPSSSVRFAHYTVQQYLFKKLYLEPQQSQDPDVAAWNAGISETARWFQSQMQLAEEVVATTCIAYLNFSDFETTIALRPTEVRFNNSGILGPGGAGSIATTVGIGKPVIDVMYKVLGGRARPTALDVDFAKYLHVKPKATTLAVTTKHVLLDYIIKNWPWHINSCKETHIVLGAGSLFNLVFEKQLSFEFRPWGPNRHFGPYGCASCWTEPGELTKPKDLIMTSMMHWAAEQGLVIFFMLLMRHRNKERDGLVFGPSVKQMLENYLFEKHFVHERYSLESMFIACRNGRSEVFEYIAMVLDQEEVLIDVISSSNLCMISCASGHEEIVKMVFHFGIFTLWPQMSSHLFAAAANGHAPVVRYLLHLRKDAQYVLDPLYHDESTGLTALHSAAANCHEEIVRLLGSIYVDVDVEDMRSNSTALHLAADHGHTSVVILLLAFGASMFKRDSDDMTPLLLAAKNGHLAVVRCLIERGTDLGDLGGIYELEYQANVIRGGQLSPLMWAAANGHTKVVDLLLDFGFDAVFNGPSDLGWTAGHLAASNGHVKALEKLIDRGAKTVADVRGWSGVHFAARNGHDDCLEVFASCGISMDSLTDNSNLAARTAIHLATEAKQASTIITLGRLGADLKRGDMSYQTAYEVRDESHTETLEALLQAENAQVERPPLWLLKCALNEDWRKLTTPLRTIEMPIRPEILLCGDGYTMSDNDVSYARQLKNFMLLQTDKKGQYRHSQLWGVHDESIIQELVSILTTEKS